MLVRGPGTGTSDSIIARVSNGEYILPKAAVDMVGKKKLDKIRNAANALHPLPRFAMGGPIDETANRQISVNSGMGGQENDLSTANSMNRAAATLKSMRTPDPVAQPTDQEKQFEAFKSMFSGQQPATAAAPAASSANDFMGIKPLSPSTPMYARGGAVELPRFAGGGDPAEVIRARNALLRREPATSPLEVRRAQDAIKARAAATPELVIPIGDTSKILGGAKAPVASTPSQLPYPTGRTAPNLAANTHVAPIAAQPAPVEVKQATFAERMARPVPPAAPPPTPGATFAARMARPIAPPTPVAPVAPSAATKFQGPGNSGAVNGGLLAVTAAPSIWDTAKRIKGRMDTGDGFLDSVGAVLKNNVQNAVDNPMGVGSISDTTQRIINAGDAEGKEKVLRRSEAAQQGKAYVAPTAAEVTALKQQALAQPVTTAVKTGDEKPASKDVVYGEVKTITPPAPSMLNPGMALDDKGPRNTRYDGTVATTGSRATEFNAKKEPTRYETNYSVRGANGGTGELSIVGANQRNGGGTVSIMDQGNGGTVEGNVAALNRQTAALTSLREAQNPGITTGTGRFAPREEPVNTDPFGGDSEKRAKYESLINEAANEKGWGGSKRAARKMAAAEAMLAPGKLAAEGKLGAGKLAADERNNKRATAAQQMQAQMDAEAQAAQRAQTQDNWNKNHGLQVRQQIVNEGVAISNDARAQTEADRKGFAMGNSPTEYAERRAKQLSNDKFKADPASIAKDIDDYFGSGIADPTQTSSYIKKGPVSDGEYDKAMAMKSQYEKEKVKDFAGIDALWPDDDRSFSAWLKSKKETTAK